MSILLNIIVNKLNLYFMKTYVLNGDSHICFDDEEKTIFSVTNSTLLDNCAVAYTKDPMAFYGLHQSIMSALSGSQNFGAMPAFFPDTEENFNAVRVFVMNKLNNL
jgi:hypothetical protein